jgi:hypothetical protein
MKAGDLVEFRCIGAGKTDNPPYSQDGERRIGLMLGQRKKEGTPFHMLNIYYRGIVVVTLAENCCVVGE